ncbi:duplicated homeodomain-like superfamily protein [Striga asiatica]|uniref:Duplicated homeodomain-like superfamily protein n=1 Tax=Striga asiatica TaxID=4170 RepID=A0A5A7QSM5_STRAF|nr:duplicated homeodomain-like superfamily protein [Striga asiatica]
MLGVTAGLTGTPGGGAPPAAREGQESGGASGGSSEVGGPGPINPGGGGGFDESDRSVGGGGNRWPRQETVALLKIRSDMDAVFRDASLKGPLWEEVSRKMAELGFQRSAKKCKEKFENVYKYHKRTKDGRAAKPDGKSYRFFDQLEAFESSSVAAAPPPPPPRPPPTTAAQPPPPPPPNLQIIPPNITASSSNSPTPLTIIPPISAAPPFPPPSSSTSSDEDMQMERRRRRRKRNWEEYFEGLVGEIVRKQEEMQNRFLEALERRELERAARDEAWRAEEAARFGREREFLAQERSAAAAKDKAVLALLQKVAREQNLQIPMNPDKPPPAPPAAAAADPPEAEAAAGGSSRWPKAEVEALIKLRMGMEMKYQENGPKGPLWEEISGEMGKLGYRRSAKRCKEKWENINKYYKKVKESKKTRPEDSKTCPYFHQLEEIYREKGSGPRRAEGGMPAAIMARPEQQWPISEQQGVNPVMMMMHGNESKHSHEEEDEDDDEEYDDEDEDDDEAAAAAYEIMASKQPQQQPAASVGNAAE